MIDKLVPVSLAIVLAALPTSGFAWFKHYDSVVPNISCPSDRLVWVNTHSGIYHLEGERWFGLTGAGRYECEKAARAEGDRETSNGQ